MEALNLDFSLYPLITHLYHMFVQLYGTFSPEQINCYSIKSI